MSLLKNSTIVVAGIIISNLLAYVFHFVVGRILGPADYGVFGALFAIFMILTIPMSAISSGVSKFTARFVSKKEDSKIDSLLYKIFIGIIVYSLIIFVLAVVLRDFIANYIDVGPNTLIILVAFSAIVSLFCSISRGYLQGIKSFGVYSCSLIFESTIRLVIVLLLFAIGFGAGGAIVAFGAGYFITFLALIPFIKIKKAKKRINITGVYRFIFLVLVTNLLIHLLINAPTIFIKHYFSSEFTGLWTAALTIARISLFVTSAIALVMFPEVASRENHKDKKQIFNKSFLLTLVSSVGIAIAFFLFGKFAILLLYGSAYLPAVPILVGLGIAMIFLSLLQLWLNYWLAKRS